MFIELHILQNFAPSNLNRDDTGAPKDCEFGGYRRARISSQCLKRAIRQSFRTQNLLAAEDLAKRTRLLVNEIAKRLQGRGKAEADARAAVKAALQGVKLGVGDGDRSQYLLFVAENEISGLAELCIKHWDKLLALSRETTPAKSDATAKDKKKAAKEAIPEEIVKEVSEVLDKGRAADLALFGRMLADLPAKNRDAACQVAHAISTHKVSMEFDFYTAVDDLQKAEEEPGAGMLGTVEFNSACFYRYANIDLEQLKKNLGGDEELATKTLEAFLRASVAAIPTGKQNSMAAQNPPSFVFAVARETGLWSLANSFLKPVRAQGDEDVVQASISALDVHWEKLAGMYETRGIKGKWLCTLDGDGLKTLADDKVDSFNELVAKVMASVSFAPPAQ